MEVTVSSTNNCDVVVIDGRIDSYTAPQLLETLKQINAQNRYKIVLDLSEVSYVSSAGLRVFIDVQKICKKSDGGIVFVNIPQRVYETLELAGFVPLFKFYNNVTAALAAF